MHDSSIEHQTGENDCVIHAASKYDSIEPLVEKLGRCWMVHGGTRALAGWAALARKSLALPSAWRKQPERQVALSSCAARSPGAY